MSEQWYWAFGDPDGQTGMYVSPATYTAEMMVETIMSAFAPPKGKHDAQCNEITVVEGRIYLHNKKDNNWWYFARKE